MSRLPTHPQDYLSAARDAARLADLDRRISDLERQRLNYCHFYQASSSATADGMFFWDGVNANTDTNLFKAVASGGKATNGGIQIARPGLYFVSASVLVGGTASLAANTHYEVAFRVGGTIVKKHTGESPANSGYFSASWVAPVRINGANVIIDMHTVNTALNRYGDATGHHTFLVICQISS